MSREVRRGASLLEALIAALGLLLLVTLALRVFGDLAGQAAAHRARAARLQSSRIARSVLRAELAEAAGAGEVAVLAPDSLRMRAFRGVGFTCPDLFPDSVLDVRWTGRRAPDPGKDSVLALLPDGTWSLSNLVRVTVGSGSCRDGAGVISTWTVRPALPGAVLLRLFEPGSYHLSDGALRYRSGRSGRQPLTESALGAAGFAVTGDAVSGQWPVLAAEARVGVFLARLRTPE